VKTPSRVYWLDPTNQQSYLGINLDIMDRTAVVLVPGEKSFRDHTPIPDMNQSAMTITEVISPLEGKDAHVEGELELTGLPAEEFTTTNMSNAKMSSDSIILSLFVPPSLASNWKIDDYKLPERISKDQKFKVRYDENDFFQPSTKGIAFFLMPPENYGSILTTKDSRETDLNLGFPHRATIKRFLKGVKLQGHFQKECSIDSKWLTLSRVGRQNKDTLEIGEIYNTKTNRITAAELKTPEFKNLQAKMKSCFDAYVLELKPTKTWKKRSEEALMSRNLREVPTP
jgi:hypothetical protein